MISSLWIRAVFALSLALFACTSPPRFQSAREFSVHRGDTSAGYENTRDALLSALRIGRAYIELDVRPSADGELYLFHDKRVSFDNQTKSVLFSELSSGEVEKLKLPGDAAVLRLGEALQLAHSFSRSTLQLDVKDYSESTLEILARELHAAGMTDRVVIQIYTPGEALRVRSHISTARILTRASKSCRVKPFLRFHPEVIQIDAEEVSLQTIARIKALSGAKVLVKTLTPEADTPENWAELFGQGVDIILSDAINRVSPEVEEEGLHR